MRMIGSVVEEQGVTFGVVLVKKAVIDNHVEAEKTISCLSGMFGGISVVLAAQDHNGAFSYYGPKDISKFLASIDPKRIPWNEYTVS